MGVVSDMLQAAQLVRARVGTSWLLFNSTWWPPSHTWTSGWQRIPTSKGIALFLETVLAGVAPLGFIA